jgi:hypothetical protein
MAQLSEFFVAKCQARILETFDHLRIPAPTFERREGDLPYLAGEFVAQGKRYTIEIYDKTVVMHQDRHYYECYMRAEWKSEDALINSFVARLERLLSGGSWEGPDEHSPLDKLKAIVRKGIGREGK